MQAAYTSAVKVEKKKKKWMQVLNPVFHSGELNYILPVATAKS